MNQPKENSEFRSVHAANEALLKYKESGKNLNIIKSIDKIDRFDVWLTVFEKEREAYREIQIKELYSMLLDNPQIFHEITASLYIVILTRLVEYNLPLSLEDGVKIILDGLSHEHLPSLQNEAEICYKRRQKIIKPYFKKDSEWVNYSKKVMIALNKIKK